MSLINKKNTSIICPDNDGESRKIVEIAKKLSFDTRVSCQKWGADLSKEPEETFTGLKKNVFIIEIPGEKKEKELREDKRLFILDHHKYEFDDRSHPVSALEQFACLVEYRLDRKETGIALNDRGYIYLLLDSKYSEEEITEIRKYDLSAQGYEEGDFTQAEEDYRQSGARGDVTVTETRSNKTAYLSDLHFLNRYKKSSDLLILTLDQNNLVREVNFYGTPETASALHKKNGGFSGGDETRSMFWGKVNDKPVTKEEMLKILPE